MLQKNPSYFALTVPKDKAEYLNQALYKGYQRYVESEDTRKSHYYEGRYENIYISREKLPEINIVLDYAIEAASEILGIEAAGLKAGLWFNVMPPGSRTLKHAHDDDDELLSAVYYVEVPENSGRLRLFSGRFMTEVTPQEGVFVFFPPDVQHDVTENLSKQIRLSLGINIGPKTD